MMLQYCVLQSSLCSSLACAKWPRSNRRSDGCRGGGGGGGYDNGENKLCCCFSSCCQFRVSTRFSSSGRLSVWRRLRRPYPHLILSLARGGLGAQPSYSSKGEREEEEEEEKKTVVVAQSQVNGSSSSSNSGIDQRQENMRKTSSERRFDSEEDKARMLESSEAYPMIRVFKNDLCRLEITGDALPWQVIAAMGADGGLTAAEELAKGKFLMTIETLIPGRSADHSSISTKLLAPTRVVAERSRTIWAREKQRFSGLSSGSAFGTAFQSVVMQRLLQFQLCFYIPGTWRDMEDLAHEQEAEIVVKIEGLDGNSLESLARVVCTYALAYRKENKQQQDVLEGSIWSRFSMPFYKPKHPVSAVHICPLLTAEMLGYKERFLKEASSLGDRHRDGVHLDQPSRSWWSKAAPAGFVLQKGWEVQVNEYLPVHKLQIDLDKLHVQAFGGQKKTNAHKIWEIHLSHAQMVDLADVLDMYYEDDISCPGKVLLTDVELKVPRHSWSKVTQAIWVAGLSGVVGGALLICLLVAARLRGISITHAQDLQSSPVSLTALTHLSFLDKLKGNCSNREPLMPKNKDASDKELEMLCGLVVGILKDSFKWPCDIESQPGRGAWIGTDLTQWDRTFPQGQVADEQEVDSHVRDNEAGAERNGSDDVIQSVSNDARADSVTYESFEAGSSASPQIQPSPSDENIFVFQVVVSRKGKVLGFQPGNKAAISKWANYPFAKMLHRGRNLGAGLIEAGVKYTRPPDDCIVLELLVQDNLDMPCVTVRPLQL